LRVLLDTNVVITLVLDFSLSRRVVEKLREAEHEIWISPAIIEETRDKLLTSPGLRKWLAAEDDIILRFLDLLPSLFNIAPGLLTLAGEVPDDPNDAHVVAAAFEISADYIVSEDHHLLDLSPWRGIEIVTRGSMLAQLERHDVHEPKPPGG
jgi:putative PIN family toxin of toxin-antitoxin system